MAFLAPEAVELGIEGGEILAEVGPEIATAGRALAEQTVENSSKVKEYGRIFLTQGLIPGLGFAEASNLIDDHTKKNKGVTNKDIRDIHVTAQTVEESKNMKLPNGKTFDQARNDWIEENKDKLNEVLKDPSKLYNSDGTPTEFHKKAVLHHVILDKQGILSHIVKNKNK